MQIVARTSEFWLQFLSNQKKVTSKVKLQVACFSIPLLLATPLATIVQLILELDGSGLWFPTIPDEEEVILVIVALISGFISMAITTEHIWADKSATYSLDRHILVVPGTKENFRFKLIAGLPDGTQESHSV